MSRRLRWLRMRVSQARSSSSLRALPSESIGSACSTCSKRSSGGAPTRWVGESGLRSSRVLGLDRAQLVEQRVVLVVADLRVVEDVVAAVVVLELATQLGGPPLGLGAHTEEGALAASISSRPQPRSRSSPPWSVRSKWIGVTEMRPRATAERSVPSSSSKRRLEAVDLVAPLAALGVLSDQLQLVVVEALAELGDLDPVRLAGGAVDVDQRLRGHRLARSDGGRAAR